MGSHFCNPVLFFSVFSDMFQEKAVVYFRGEKNPLLQYFLVNLLRYCAGTKVYQSQQSRSMLLQNFHDKKVNILLVDRRTHRGTSCTLLNSPSSMFYSPFAYAHQTNALLYYCYIQRDLEHKNPHHFKVVVQPIDTSKLQHLKEEQAVKIMIQNVADTISEHVQETPEQWLGWLQKRGWF
jgi:lauroyl/myristoyl acyltransferase